MQISEHKYKEADQTYDRAAIIQDVMIGNADSTLGKTALIKAASDLYAKHFALVAEHIGDTKKAFAIVEQVRGRQMKRFSTSPPATKSSGLSMAFTTSAICTQLRQVFRAI